MLPFFPTSFVDDPIDSTVPWQPTVLFRIHILGSARIASELFAFPTPIDD